MISVIVPVYNVEDYLPHCLESIASQTYTDFEAILVDDGSTDSSGRICDGFCARDPRFRVIHQENQGLSGARNTGLGEVRGEYVCFIDSDDYIAADMLEALYEAISISDEYDLAVVGLRKTSRTDEDARPDRNIGEDCPLSVDTGEGMIGKMLGQSAEENVLASVVWNKLYPTRLLQGLSFRDVYGCEDVDFCYRVFLRAGKVVRVRRELYFYLQRPGSIVGDTGKRDRRTLNRLQVYHDVLCVTESHRPSLRAQVLEKLYRTILTSRYHLYGTPLRREAEGMYARIIRETRHEYLCSRDIPHKEKAQFFLLWRFPFLMRFYMRYTGN